MQEIITRHRFEPVRRELEVKEVINLTPKMRRVVVGGAELEGFISLGADDHIKLLFDGEMRDYTPRAYDLEAKTLTLDFAIHEAGPATAWALDAAVGDRLRIAGPRGSAVVNPLFDWYLLIADETGLPAMGRWAESLPAEVEVITLGLITDAAEEQSFDVTAKHTAHWAYREDAASREAVLPAVSQLTLPEGRGFIWIAAEALVARAIRDHFALERGHPREAMKAAGYWVKGTANASDKALD